MMRLVRPDLIMTDLFSLALFRPLCAPDHIYGEREISERDLQILREKNARKVSRTRRSTKRAAAATYDIIELTDAALADVQARYIKS